MQHLDVGETRVLSVDFANDAGDATNPTTVTLTVTDPDGTATTPPPTVTGTPTGHYEYLLDPNTAGWWTARWDGQGNGVDTFETSDILVGVTPAQAGPCEAWCSWDDAAELALPVDLAPIDLDEREQLLDFATAILYGETGRRYPGMCKRTMSVCDIGVCGCMIGWPYDNPAGADPSWWGYPYAGRRGCGWFRCTGAADHVDFGELRFPLVAARNVTAFGAVVPRSSWRIDDQRFLVRTDGGAWPACPNLTDPSQFKATILYGREPFAGGDRAAAALAAEMGKFTLQGSCNLPENVTDIIRQGITYRVRDSKDLLDSGLSGVPTTDRWLAAEKLARIPPPGGVDPARDPTLLRAGTDRGGDR